MHVDSRKSICLKIHKIGFLLFRYFSYEMQNELEILIIPEIKDFLFQQLNFTSFFSARVFFLEKQVIFNHILM